MAARDEELSFSERDLDALLKLSESLVNTHDIEGTLHEISVMLAQVMKADRCSIILLDHEGLTGFIVAASDDPQLRNHRIEIAAYPEIREVVRTSEPLVITDVQRAPLFEPVRDKIKGKPVASTTIFPVRIDRRVQGVLMLRERAVKQHPLGVREARFGRIVANATAIAIRNARLYEMIRDRSERRLSERLKAERRLRQIEKYQRFFDLAGDGLMIVDAGARILFANRAALAILGFEARVISQVRLSDLVEPARRSEVDALMKDVQGGAAHAPRDLEVVRASGETAILSLTCAALEDPASTGELPRIVEGKFHDPVRSQDLAVIVSFRDVTATRKMEEELRTTKDFLLNLIESSADAIVASDMHGKILVFNKVAERITGHLSTTILGTEVRQLYPPGVAKEIMADLRSPGYGGVGKLQDRRQSLVTKGGELVPISLSAAIVYDQEREVATVGIFSDLRERMKIEEKLQKAQHQLELSERQAAVVELAGAAAHELNQPLTSIMGSAELMLRKLPPESPMTPSIKTLLSEAERMAEIVKKLGQITKYETKPYVGATNILDLDAASKARGD
jgi:PAS domain S-box-containing protein